MAYQGRIYPEKGAYQGKAHTINNSIGYWQVKTMFTTTQISTISLLINFLSHLFFCFKGKFHQPRCETVCKHNIGLMFENAWKHKRMLITKISITKTVQDSEWCMNYIKHQYNNGILFDKI